MFKRYTEARCDIDLTIEGCLTSSQWVR